MPQMRNVLPNSQYRKSSSAKGHVITVEMQIVPWANISEQQAKLQMLNSICPFSKLKFEMFIPVQNRVIWQQN